MRCQGFRFGVAACGIKPAGALDLGVIHSVRPAATAAVFTQNRVKAAPVVLSQQRLRKSEGMSQAIVVCSGNANACTGPQGTADAREMSQLTAHATGVDMSQVLVASTGVIGVPLPMTKLQTGIITAANGLKANNFGGFAEAIMTTDRSPKLSQRRLKVAGTTITLLGCTKGAGMIAPNMATTLSFVVTDAKLSPARLQALLQGATDSTFNAMTVDGDTSTNDMIAVMANGAAGAGSLRGKAFTQFGDALHELLDELARKLMADAEGVHHVVDIVVTGARTNEHATRIAHTIANSPLVKTMFCGRDPNWGRVAGAAGRAGVPLRWDQCDLTIAGIALVSRGQWLGAAAEKRVQKAMAKPSYDLTLRVGDGTGTGHCLACDLSHEYVSLNADYRS